MPFKIYGLYVPRECWSNNTEMAEDDHVPDNTKYTVVISSEAGPDLRSFLKYKSCNSSHCKNCKYLLLLQILECQIPVSKKTFLSVNLSHCIHQSCVP